MKYLLSVILISFCVLPESRTAFVGPAMADTCKMDSVWGTFEVDTMIFVGENGGRRYSFKTDIDSSRWYLYKIDSAGFYYYKMFIYACGTKWVDSSGCFRYSANCLTAHGEFKHGISQCLIDECRVSDTIPYEMKFYNYNEKEKVQESWKEYWVGFLCVKVGEKTYKKLE